MGREPGRHEGPDEMIPAPADRADPANGRALPPVLRRLLARAETGAGERKQHDEPAAIIPGAHPTARVALLDIHLVRHG
jgi:hypothetical protein